MRNAITWFQECSLIWQLWTVIDAHYEHSAIYRYMQRNEGYVLHILAFGALWTLLICRAMGKSYERATYELLAITPGNTPLSAGLFVSLGVMHRAVDKRGHPLAALVWIARGSVIVTWLLLPPPSASEANILAQATPMFSVWIPVVMLMWLKLYDLILAPILGLSFAYSFQESNFIPFIAGTAHLILVAAPILLMFAMYSLAARQGSEFFIWGSVLIVLVVLAACELIVRVGWLYLRRSMNVTHEDAQLLLDAYL